jgi:hypothetical protein
MQYYHITSTFFVTNYSCLRLAKYVEGIYYNTLRLSRKKTREVEKISEEEEKYLEKSDDAMVEDWKNLFIITMMNMYPPKLRKHLPFETWRQAMNWMAKEEKRYGLDKV